MCTLKLCHMERKKKREEEEGGGFSGEAARWGMRGEGWGEISGREE